MIAPIALTIGPLPVRWYGVIMALSVPDFIFSGPVEVLVFKVSHFNKTLNIVIILIVRPLKQ